MHIYIYIHFVYPTFGKGMQCSIADGGCTLQTPVSTLMEERISKTRWLDDLGVANDRV